MELHIFQVNQPLGITYSNNMNFTSRLSPRNNTPTSSTHHVVLIKHLRDNSGRLAWYFVKIATTKYAAFKRQLEQKNVDLSSYGEVLASGYGEQPPLRVQQRMTRVYGFKE